MEDRQLFDAMLAVVKVCEAATPSLADQLLVLELAWVAKAQNARGEALAIGGFVDEQARQVARLARLVVLIEGDVPDLELERLYVEHDHEGAARHIHKLIDAAEMDDDEPAV
jgi:hypothetical protein